MPPTRSTGTVYFIAAGPFVKIGWTGGKVRTRFWGIQSSCPYPLVLLGIRTGSKRHEAEFHQQFAAHHYRGEWFHLAPEIERYIARKCVGTPKRLQLARFSPPSDVRTDKPQMTLSEIQ